MFRLFPVNGLESRKKLLVAQSDLHRQTLLVQLDTVQQSVAKIKHRFTLLGLSSVALGVGASAAGMLFSKKSAPSSGGGGFISKIFSAFSTFNQVRGLINRFKPPAPDGE